MPVAHMLRLRRTVNESLAGLPLRWAEPAKSCSTTAAEERTVLTARYERGALSEAQRLAVFSQLRRETEELRTFMCEEDIFADSSAPLLEATDTEAMLAVWPLC